MLGIGLSVPQIAESSTAFNPLSLFAAGEQGAWYDPSDLSTLFQDTAGTTPVTATGQSVARINDKSGRGNNATQATSGSRPTLQQDASGLYFLLFDGTDDSLATSAINFSATDKITACAGVRKLSDAASGVVTELSTNFSSVNGSFVIFAPSGAAANYAIGSRGTSGTSTSIAGFAAPVTSVVTCLSDIAAPALTLRVNGSQRAQSTTTQGTGNFGNQVLYIGRRGGSSLPFNGRLYSLIIRGAASSAGDIAKMEAWVNGKTGAY